MVAATFPLIAPSSGAAATIMSTGRARTSSFASAFNPLYPTTERVFFLCSDNAAMSRPCSSYTPPLESVTATMLAPNISFARVAANVPALPNPIIATFALERSSLISLAASRRVNIPPLAVASLRPSDPPTAMGLPVTTPNWFFPLMMEYSSIIHAIIWPVVYTSGAGMSMSGPMSCQSARI